MNKGVETLSSNWQKWNSILENSSKTSAEYAKAMQDTRKALSDILDVSEEFITVDFVAKHLELIGKAAEGNADAIDDLSYALAKNIVSQSIDMRDIISIDGIEYVG
jgi:hypothetical protein